MKNKIILLAACLLFAASISAQPRPVEKKTENPSEQKTAVKTPAPNSFEAKYEGGIYGFSQREKGTLKFEDANERIVFYGKDGKEKFSIPYNAMLVIYPQSKSQRSTTGQVVGAIPVPGAGIAGLFMREKLRYLVINFEDPQVDVKGTANFKLDNKELLESVILTLAQKAELKQRGDAFYRPKNAADSDE